MPFMHSIRYEEARENAAAAATVGPTPHLAAISAPSHSQLIRLRFWTAEGEQLQTIDVHVAKHNASAGFVCDRLDCSLVALQPSVQQLLQSSFLGSSGSSAYLFRLVESVVRLLRDHSRTRRPAEAPQAALAARRFAAALRSRAPATILSKSLAFDVYLSLLASAAHSGRSCTLVNPVPLSCRSLTAAAAAEGEQDAAIVRLQTALQQMPPLVPLCMRTGLSQQADLAVAAALQASLPVTALSLLSDAARMVDLLSLHCIDEPLHAASSTACSSAAASPRGRWFQFDNDGGSNLSCPAPHWVLDVAMHDPHFDELVHAHVASAAAASSSAVTSAAQSQLLQVYHGSPVENWHSILHRGLQNHSGTKHQSSGALFGQGVYFSDDLRVARNFSKAGRNPLHGDASAAGGASMLGARVEVVGVYDLLIPAVPAASLADASPPPVRRAPPRDLSSGSSDDVPDNYFVVTDTRYARLKHLLIWRADGVAPGRIGSVESLVKVAMHSPAAVAPVAGLPRMIAASQSSASAASLSCADRVLQWLRALFSGPGMIVAYALVLLAIGMAQVDWHRTRRIAEHWWRVQAAGKRF